MSQVDAWFASERGIASDTLDAFGVRRDDKSATFPYSNGQKTRTGFDGGERGFKFTAGVTPALFTPPGDLTGVNIAFLCEGESDTMRLWQELKGGAVFGLAGVNTWRDEFRDVLAQFDTVFVVLDNESEYDNPRAYEAVEACWQEIRSSLGIKKSSRIKLPLGTKDLCEFFNDYDLDMLRLLATQRSTAASRFRPLDLNAEPPPVQWLLDGLIARGDMTLLSGASGLGKSWFTMGLAVAVADKHDTFLGLKVAEEGGRVLYFDEENPEDVVFHRLRKLGLKNKGNVRYLWNNGIRVDRHPEILLEEAVEYDPVLIVLDSLTRIHGKEENLAGEMAPLLNEAIRPLARETGAAVVLIHHHDKAGNGPRGSGDITASMDGALDIFAAGVPGQFSVKLSKSRRRLAGRDFSVKIEDLEGDLVRLHATTQLDSPF